MLFPVALRSTTSPAPKSFAKIGGVVVAQMAGNCIDGFIGIRKIVAGQFQHYLCFEIPKMAVHCT